MKFIQTPNSKELSFLDRNSIVMITATMDMIAEATTTGATVFAPLPVAAEVEYQPLH